MTATASARRVRFAVALTGLGFTLLTGCGGHGGDVTVTAPKPAAAQTDACATLIARLPDDLATGGHRRSTHPNSPYAAAFGTPPVIVRCGAAIPRYSLTSDVLTVGGIDWLIVPDGVSTHRFVSYHSELPVEVTVTLPQLPANVLPPVAALLNELAPKTPPKT